MILTALVALVWSRPDAAPTRGRRAIAQLVAWRRGPFPAIVGAAPATTALVRLAGG